MNTNPRLAKIIIVIYSFVTAALYLISLYDESKIPFVAYSVLLILLLVWIFINAGYFLSFLKRNEKARNVELTLIKILCVLLIGSSCLTLYVNIIYL